MKITDSIQNACATSPTSPPLLRGPYRHCSSQILIITYRVCRAELEHVSPQLSRGDSHGAKDKGVYRH